MDGGMLYSQTFHLMLFETGKNHWEIVELPSSPGWDGERGWR